MAWYVSHIWLTIMIILTIAQSCLNNVFLCHILIVLYYFPNTDVEG